MTSLPGFLLRHSITVYAKAGSGAYGPTYSAAVATKAHIIFGTPTGRSSQESYDITPEVTMYIRPNIVCPVDSKVVYASNSYRVVKYTKHSSPGLPTPDHIKLVLAPYAEES